MSNKKKSTRQAAASRCDVQHTQQQVHAPSPATKRSLTPNHSHSSHPKCKSPKHDEQAQHSKQIAEHGIVPLPSLIEDCVPAAQITHSNTPAPPCSSSSSARESDTVSDAAVKVVAVMAVLSPACTDAAALLDAPASHGQHGASPHNTRQQSRHRQASRNAANSNAVGAADENATQLACLHKQRREMLAIADHFDVMHEYDVVLLRCPSVDGCWQNSVAVKAGVSYKGVDINDHVGTIGNGKVYLAVSAGAADAMNLGLFAGQLIECGSIITEYAGVVKHKSQVENASHTLRISDSDYVIDALGIADDIDRQQPDSSARFHPQTECYRWVGMGGMANHRSRGTNCKVVFVKRFAGELGRLKPKRAMLVATQTLQPGHEVFWNYNSFGRACVQGAD